MSKVWGVGTANVGVLGSPDSETLRSLVSQDDPRLRTVADIGGTISVYGDRLSAYAPRTVVFRPGN